MKQWELRGVTLGEPGRTGRVEVLEQDLTLGAIRDRTEPLRAVIDQIPALIWTVDHDLRFTSSLGKGFLGLGLASNQIVGIHLAELFEDADPLHACIAAHLGALDGRTTSFTLRWAGRTFRATVQPLRDALGTAVGAVGVALEVPSIQRRT
jgi:PAS domain-containing protein